MYKLFYNLRIFRFIYNNYYNPKSILKCKIVVKLI